MVASGEDIVATALVSHKKQWTGMWNIFGKKTYLEIKIPSTACSLEA